MEWGNVCAEVPIRLRQRRILPSHGRTLSGVFQPTDGDDRCPQDAALFLKVRGLTMDIRPSGLTILGLIPRIALLLQCNMALRFSQIRAGLRLAARNAWGFRLAARNAWGFRLPARKAFPYIRAFLHSREQLRPPVLDAHPLQEPHARPRFRRHAPLQRRPSMPAEVLSDPRWESVWTPVRAPARSFRLAIALVLASLSAISLALVGNPRSTAPVSSALLPVAMASPAIDPDDVDETPAPTPTPAKLHRGDDRDIEALTSAVARRYRVSEEAIRDVVRSSFEEARRNRLDPLLVVAIIAIESRFNPFAQSAMGAQGLMQVIPQYHADKYDAGDESMLDPKINIRVGAQVLREYIARAGNESAGLRLYNGSSDENDTGYATKVATEKQRLLAAMRKVRLLPSPIA